ncbi:glycosyltransferase family 8 protein [Planktotalea sp.]|uniref:glycosyltransferase family 8 protein n=1 Tax=Planktotalea sp. TaxID=2029877 RepID=UPI003D6BC472
MKALATVTSDGFVPATMVMLHSFLEQNQRFSGDLVLIESDLSERHKAAFQSSFERIKFVKPRAPLRENVDRLIDAMPSFGKQAAQFHSIEAIGLTQYDRVLFCDSDILFRGSIEPLFEMPYALICCGDGSVCRGTMRDPESFVEEADDPEKAGLRSAFNAGFMVMDKSIRTLENLDRLVAMIDPSKWHENATGHTDQLLFNRVFEGKQHLIGPAYNFVLLHRKDIAKRWGLGVTDARVLHFNGSAKPWKPATVQRLIQSDPEARKAVAWWNAAYKDCLSKRLC